MKSDGGYFTNLKSGMIVATFFALWLAVYFEHNVEDTLAYVLILSFGILHGANDIKLLEVTSLQRTNKLKYGYIILYYVLFVLVAAALFYTIPGIALLLFVLFSAYHFGEQHWAGRIKATDWEIYSFYTFYGLIVLSILFLAHSAEVETIIRQITEVSVSKDYLRWILAISSILSVVLYIKMVRQYNTDTILELFYLGVFFIVFNAASLLWAFAIYFIIWHSVPSLFDQIGYLYGDFNKSNFLQYLRTSLLYWAISVFALILLFVYIDDSASGFLPFLFSFLAAITFPHVFVIRKLNKN